MLLSQIQPHFVFNVLNSIISLCSIDAEKTEEMLLAFSSYLRHDINSLSTDGMIPFDKELRSVENYLKLEQMRFGERLNVEMDIQTVNFDIHPLTIQPLVENAVKHGISKKRTGGIVRISTWEENDTVFVQIADNGIGFDSNQMNAEDDHVGLENVRERLRYKMNAKLEIQSEPGNGTIVTVMIPGSPKRIKGQVYA